jgi:hypothetical protein
LNHLTQGRIFHAKGDALANQARGVQDEDLGVRDRLADRIGPAVNLFRREIRRPERFGQPLHQKWLGAGDFAPQQTKNTPSGGSRTLSAQKLSDKVRLSLDSH